MNGIINNGKVYEAVEGASCEECAFDKDTRDCVDWCELCYPWRCAFRYSPSLTDKINGNGIQQEDTSAGL